MRYIFLTTLACVLLSPYARSQGYFLGFDSDDLSGWSGGDYALSISDQSLSVAADGVGSNYEAFSYAFDAIDMTATTEVSVKIRTNSNVTVRIDLMDINGYVSNTHEVKFEVKEDQFQMFTFDFDGKFSQSYPSEATLDASQITGIMIYLNPGGPSYSGTTYFDNFLIGGVDDPVISLSGNLHFGKTLLNSPKEREITLANKGGAELAITASDVPAGFEIKDLPATVAAGSSAVFSVSFTPTEERSYSGSLSLTSNAALGDETLPVSGEGVTTVPPGELNGLVRVNQIGYYPHKEKLGVVVDGIEGMAFKIRSEDLEEVLYNGTLTDERHWDKSGEDVAIADFTEFTETGSFVLDVPEIGRSFPFRIEDNVFGLAGKASLRAYYYNRASMALDPEYAGQWARAAGHPDTDVWIHSSAASDERPENTVIASPKGWYDAGDFGKYVVNGGISVHTLLAAYEAFPSYYDQLDLNIPESGNDIPDVLDEVLWELDWMLTMQDPNDGGVYHKLTTSDFTGMIMPAEATGQRYVYYKSTAAALNFAAVMAQASRIYEPFDPERSATFLTAADDALTWAEANPSRFYDQEEINATYDPDVNTGPYGDSQVTDEFNWARIELYITTKDDAYLSEVDFDLWIEAPSWPGTNFLGFASLLNNKDNLTAAVSYNDILNKTLDLADDLRSRRQSAAYQISHNTFNWGSNSTAGNEGLVLMYAYLHTNDESYFNAALSIVDYLLGRNAVNYSFLSGFGDKRVMNIHHRQSEADGIEEPVPGFIAGGPDGFWASQDFCDGMTFDPNPAKAFDDVSCAYSMTEVTINWNAPFVFLTGALESLTSVVREETSGPEMSVISLTSTSATLSWNDKFTDEDGYALERSDNEEGPFATIATLDANTSQYEDAGLTRLSTYFYRIKGLRGEVSSAYSEVLAVETPDFFANQEFSIDENSAEGSVIGTLSAEIDEGGSPDFTILSGNEENAVAIDAVTGEIAIETASLFDFESNASFALEVEASDGNGNTATATVTIYVNDVNEMVSVSDQAFFIDENPEPGAVLGYVSASDADGDPIAYHIVSGNTAEAFALDQSSGAFTVNNSEGIDFETTPEFSITIQVEDGRGSEDEAIVTVAVNNVNEKPVIWPAAFEINEDAKQGDVIGAVSAEDEDGDDLSFSIVAGNTGDIFTISSETGEITIAGEPNLDEVEKFTLTVEVSDGVLTAAADITIDVTRVTGVSGEKTEALSIYPNPVSGGAIYLNANGVKINKAELIDEFGKVLKSKSKDAKTMDVSGLSTGIYYLKIYEDNGRVATKKLVIE